MLEYCKNKIKKIEIALEKKQYKLRVQKAVISVMQDIITTYKDKAEKADTEANKIFFEDVKIQLNAIIESYFENLE